MEATVKPSNPCPNCHHPLPEGLPIGRCPHCLLQAATQESAPLGGPSARFIPPSAADLDARLDAFEVLELIGRGGMGAVYKAIHLRLDRVVAIKVLPPELAESDPAFGERFLREARALAKLQHPNLVVVHDFGEADGLYFIVMEYVEGPNLRRLIQSGNLPPARTLEILPQICSGLRYAHSQGLIHRDIKPENILVGDDGRVRITDFGLARLVDPSPTDISLTASTHAPGTPHYMAPEQLRDPDGVDHRVDIFALGVMFYEMLTGHLPQGRFALPSEEVSVDSRVDDVVLRSLEPNPQMRYQQADEVTQALEQPLEDVPEWQRSPTREASAQNKPEEEERDPAPKKKVDLSAGPLFPDRATTADDLRTDGKAIRMKAMTFGLFIALASLLPWGGMETESGIAYPAQISGGTVNFFGLTTPLWIVPVAGIAIAIISGFQLIKHLPHRWRTLQRICIVGIYFCIYAFFYYLVVYLSGHSHGYRSHSPDMPAPGFGAIVCGILFFYTYR